MTDDELNELLGVAKLSKPYAYNTNIHTCTSSITPRPRVLVLPTVWSPTDELLAWAGLALVEEENGGVYTEGNPCQWLPPTSTTLNSLNLLLSIKNASRA